MKLRHLCVVAGAAAAVLLLVPAEARTRQGDRYAKEAQQAEVREDWDRAVELYQQAVDEDPADSGYTIGMRRARFQSGQMHVDQGQRLRSEGNLAEAIAEFQRAILTDPSSAIALQELKRTQEMLSGPAGPDGRVLTPAEQAEEEQAERVASIMGVPELDPPVKRIPMLRMNNQPVRILYDTVAKIAGVTVVWDSTWNPPTRNFDVELPEESGVEQAFDYLALVTRTYWKPITDTTIFVTEDSANKRRDFGDQVVKTFFVTNATSVQEFQEISTAVRTITDIRRVYTYNALKAMVVRGDVEAVDLAEKLIRDLDRPKAEVVVDVFIMEANSARTRDLAATITNAGTAGLNIPVAFTPRSSIQVGGEGGGSTIPLARLGNLSSGDFTTTLPGALLQAMLNDTQTRLLSSPQVRASDGMQVTLNIGDRVPIATGSFQSGVGGVGAFPGVNTQFQYIDVGVNVDITPQVHSADEVTLHVDIEVSNVRNFVDLGNIQQPVVRQNKGTADLRLREGEVSILSGLSQNQQTETVNGIPGLVNIPVLGKFLFGSQHTEEDHGDLMIALIPHIVRTPNYSRENLRGVYSGFDQVLDLRYAPDFGDEQASGQPEAEPTEGLQPTAPPATAPPATAPPATAPPKTVPQAVGQPPATAPPPQPANAPPAEPPGALPEAPQARVTFMPGVVTVPVNSPFTVNVQLENATGLFSVMPLRVSWDPALLRMNDIAPGELLSRDGPVTAVKDIRNDTGQATLIVNRPPGQPGVTGSGAIATLTFVAAGAGSGTVTVTELEVFDTQNQSQPVTLGALPVAVQ